MVGDGASWLMSAAWEGAMRRSLVFMLALATAVLTAIASGGAAAAASGNSEAEATLVSFNGSGITAEIEFLDTGSTLIVDGEATGLNPTKSYFSLIYSTPGHGPTACDGTPLLTERQMVLGFWRVDSEGEGTLHVVKSKSTITPALPFLGPGNFYAPIGSFHSVSVRNASAGFRLEACGDVVGDS